MKTAIVGKNGTLWNARATINFDNHEQCKQLANILLKQRNEMYGLLKHTSNTIRKMEICDSYLYDLAESIDELLAKARGE